VSAIPTIPTPSIQTSGFETLANSTVRAEADKESARFTLSLGAPSIAPSSIGQSIGAPSICGSDEGGSHSKKDVECQSFVGSIAESRFDSQAYLDRIAEQEDNESYWEAVDTRKSSKSEEFRFSSSHSLKSHHWREADETSFVAISERSEGPPLDGTNVQEI
jgi:hypothetical protein